MTKLKAQREIEAAIAEAIRDTTAITLRLDAITRRIRGVWGWRTKAGKLLLRLAARVMRIRYRVVTTETPDYPGGSMSIEAIPVGGDDPERWDGMN